MHGGASAIVQEWGGGCLDLGRRGWGWYRVPGVRFRGGMGLLGWFVGVVNGASRFGQDIIVPWRVGAEMVQTRRS